MKSRTSEEQQKKLNKQLLKHAKNGDLKKVRADLNKGADIAATNSHGLNALQLAEDGIKALEHAIEKYGSTEGNVIRKIEKDSLIVDKSAYELIITLLKYHLASLKYNLASTVFSPLHYAAQDGDEMKVQNLLRAGADANLVFCETGETPLFIAAKFGHKKIVRLLLANGAKADMADNNGETPLDIAVSKERTEVVEILVAGKVPPRAGVASLVHMYELLRADRYHELEELLIKHQCAPTFFSMYLALHEAVKNRSVEMVRMLLRHRAPLNQTDNTTVCNTPLHLACSKKSFDIAELLVSAGARTDLNNLERKTAYDIALAQDRMEALRVFDPEIWQKEITALRLIDAVKYRSLSRVERLLTSCPDFSSISENGHSLLYLAAARGDVAICRLLIDRGAPIDIPVVKKNHDDEQVCLRITPMLIAFREGHDDVFMLLHERGSRLDYQNVFVQSDMQSHVVMQHKALALVLSGWVSSLQTLEDIQFFTKQRFCAKFTAKLLLAFQNANENDLIKGSMTHLRAWCKEKIKEKGGSEIKQHLLALMKEIPDVAERLNMHELALRKPEDNLLSFAMNVKQNVLDPRKCDTVRGLELLAEEARQLLQNPQAIVVEQAMVPVAVAEPAPAPLSVSDLDEFEIIEADISPPSSPLMRHSRFAPVMDNAAPLLPARSYQEIEMQDVEVGEDGCSRFVSKPGK